MHLPIYYLPNFAFMTHILTLFDSGAQWKEQATRISFTDIRLEKKKQSIQDTLLLLVTLQYVALQQEKILMVSFFFL